MKKYNGPKDSQPTTEIVDVTPALAKQWLTLNISNRHITKGGLEMIRMLVTAMKRGDFMLTHQGIAFDVQNNLIDGQHRLMAIVESGVTVQMLVSRGLPIKTRMCTDSGLARRVDQTLHMFFGETYAKHAVSWINTINFLLIGKPIKLSPGEAQTLLDYYRVPIEWAKRTFQNRYDSGVIGALVYAHKANPKLVEEFGESLVSLANLPPGSPVLLLAKSVEPVRRRRNDRRDVALRALRAVQVFIRKEKPISKLVPSEEPLAYFRRFHEARGES